MTFITRNVRKSYYSSRIYIGILKGYGYHPIQTPTFEFFDIFGKEIGTTPSKELYKFFDREGNTLVLTTGYYTVHRKSGCKIFYG